MQIGKTIRKYRKEKGMTQEEMQRVMMIIFFPVTTEC